MSKGLKESILSKRNVMQLQSRPDLMHYLQQKARFLLPKSN